MGALPLVGTNLRQRTAGDGAYILIRDIVDTQVAHSNDLSPVKKYMETPPSLGRLRPYHSTDLA